MRKVKNHCNTDTNKWTINGTTATYETTDKILITITGLKTDANADGITINSNVITLNASVLNKTEVTLTGEGYSLALADNVQKTTAVADSWKVSDGTAIYSGSTTAGYVLDDNKITYQAASDDESIMTLTGLNVSATDSDISMNDGVLTLSENAIGNDTITIEKTVDVSKISAGKAGNFNIRTQTFKTESEVDFILDEGNVSAVELANMQSTAFTNSADNISIIGGTGNDAITDSGSNNTIIGGAGNDTITNTGSNNVFRYRAGDGDDVIVGGDLQISLEGVHTIATNGINRYNIIIKLTQEQYEKIAKHLPR